MRKMQKSLAVLLTVAMLMVFTAGCGKDAETTQTAQTKNNSTVRTEVTAALSSIPNNLDISTTMGTSLLTIAPHVYNFLVGLDENYNFTPGVAKSWEKVDDLTWTFEIGEGFVFSNGEELEMEDIIYSIERLRDCAPMASYMSNIESASYEGRTLTVKMVEPNNLTIRNIFPTLCPILNKSYCEEHGEKAILNAECGTGPYKVVEYIPGDKVVMEVREDYPFEKPEIKKITFRQIAEQANRYIALETGEVQFATELAYKDFERAKENKNLNASSMPASGLTFITMNTKKAPFDNLNVRLAMAHAMDRDAWVAITEGVTPLYTMVSGAFEECSQKPAGIPEYDLAKAKALLEAEGYNESNPLSFEIQIYQSSPAIEAYQATLKSIGVNASIKMYERGTVVTMLRNGEGDMTLLTLYSVAGTPLFEAGAYRNGDMRNFAQFENDELNDLINKALAAETEEKMNSYIVQANEASVKYMPYIPVCNQVLYTAMDSALDGVLVRPDSSFNFTNASYK